jgi:hypothetical protein
MNIIIVADGSQQPQIANDRQSGNILSPFETINQERINPSRVGAIQSIFESKQTGCLNLSILIANSRFQSRNRSGVARQCRSLSLQACLRICGRQIRRTTHITKSMRLAISEKSLM